jgi:sporulation protein YlmC with PRC-barrel domain
MRTANLTRLIQLALAPTVAMGLSIGAHAQNTDNDSQQTKATGSSTSGSAQTTGSPGARQNTEYRGARASELIGKEVRNPAGRNLGQINDLIVDMTSGKVRYAILEFDPGIFEGERLFGVPTDQLRISPRDGQVVYDMTRSRLEQVPEPGERAMGANRTDLDVDRPVAMDRDTTLRGSPLLDRNDTWTSAWREPGYQRRLRGAGIDRQDWYDASDDTAYQARLDKIWGVKQPSDNPRAYRVSDLIGKDIRTPHGDEVGEIQDVVVNMANEKVHYVVAEFDPGWASPDRRYVFPLSEFKLSRNDDDAVLDIDKSRLQSMQSFPENGFRRMNDRSFAADVDRYLIAVFPVRVSTAADPQAGRERAMNDPSSGEQQRMASSGNDWNAKSSGQQGQMAASSDTSNANRSDRASGSDVEQAWDRYDRNNDGQVSRSEFERQYPTDANLQGRSNDTGASGDTVSQRASSN